MEPSGGLLDLAPVGVSAIDADGRIIAWNKRAEALFGTPASEAVGRAFVDFLGLDDRARWISLQARAAKLEVPEHLTLQISPRGRSTPLFVEVTATALSNPGAGSAGTGRAGLMLAFQDITERVNADAERAEHLQQTLTALGVRDEFLSVASHELRTPLTSLRLVVQSLERDLVEERSGDLARPHLLRKVQSADRQVVRLQRLVEGLLDVSSIQAGRLRLERSVVDLATVVEGAVEELRDQFVRAGCEPKLELERPVKGPWDERRLMQVVMSLLSNALRYAPGTVIEVRLNAEGPRAVLLVRDHGIGIDPTDLDRLFARFDRGSPSRNYGGLGLGLFISRKIVESHGGSIVASSRPGEGATFRVELPVTTQP